MKSLITIFLSRLFSVSFYNKLRYFYYHKKWPNLSNPQTFTEKFLAYKLRFFTPLMTTCADKYAVRDYVSNKVNQDVLIPLIAHFRTLEDFESGYDDLPEAFVLKGAHGSGWNEIVFDKSQVDYDLLRSKVKKWLSQNYYDYGRELQYKDIEHSIVVEKLLSTDDGKVPVDFKFYCFGRCGQKKIVIQVDVDRFSSEHRRVFYDVYWQKSDVAILSPKASRASDDYPKPANLEQMLQVVAKLSSDFEFSRIDLYSHKNKVYFGEITFHPEAGYAMLLDDFSEKKLLEVF